MTNEQAKQEAIKKAYCGLFNKYTYEADGDNAEKRFLSISVWIDKYGWFSGSLYNIPNDEIDISGHECRPQSLRYLDDNNGWTRIEPDGSNLPKEIGEYRVILKSGNLTELYFDPKEDLSFKPFATHYKPIKEEPKPVF